ncbi:hypothetical protein KP509_13G059300 [Ceratopteris richardii]|uniref:Uncharacterized protein n=1 Tax=Ceratopteris richardii TaxID=49495 RepID=A0A8T2TI04_CERRI|nr:hypothetical protein KP509_13G059300 [Ceratopteris richardii]
MQGLLQPAHMKVHSTHASQSSPYFHDDCITSFTLPSSASPPRSSLHPARDLTLQIHTMLLPKSRVCFSPMLPQSRSTCL